MHGNIGRDYRPSGREGAFPVILFGAVAAIGFALVMLGKPEVKTTAEPAPKAVLPSPARLRKRSERLA